FRQLSRRYRAGEKRVIQSYNERARAYNLRRGEAKNQFQARLQAYQQEKQTLLAEQEKHNGAVAEFNRSYENGKPEAIERMVQMVLDRCVYPDGVPGDPDVQVNEASQTLVVNFWLPHTSQVPDTQEYKFVATRKEVRQVPMKN